MIKKHLKTLIITSLIILLPIIAGLILWNQLPEQMPTHWNAEGEIDGWSSKPFAVFAMPLILLAAQWLIVLCAGADPKHQNHTDKIMNFIFWLIPALSVVISFITYSAALGSDMRTEAVISVFLGVMFVAIGNYLPKCKQNYTIGIKVPWALNSEENWNKTHRLAGWVWVGGGIAVMLTGFFNLFWLMMVVTAIMVLVPFIYSYILHRKNV